MKYNEPEPVCLYAAPPYDRHHDAVEWLRILKRKRKTRRTVAYITGGIALTLICLAVWFCL